MGKSSLVLRFVKGQFHEYQESTIGGLFLTHVFQIFLFLYTANKYSDIARLPKGVTIAHNQQYHSKTATKART